LDEFFTTQIDLKSFPPGVIFMTFMPLALRATLKTVEKQKLSIGAKLDEQGSTHVANFALRVFKMADDEDRSGKADKNTAKNFLASSQFMEVLGQFGEIPVEIQEKRRTKAPLFFKCAHKIPRILVARLFIKTGNEIFRDRVLHRNRSSYEESCSRVLSG
jgi:hypothetical protein